MRAFDQVIGYESIKAELVQICDMIKNRKTYERLGAKLPSGILLDGAPGLGKTLLAKCFIEESGLKAVTVRKSTCGHDFVYQIDKAYRDARANAPAIVFLDDMDKFANEDYGHRDAEEYVAIQSCIDESKGCSVFTLATTNDIRKLPRSLVRSGRFDRKIEVDTPSSSDAEKIIAYFLSNKKIAPSVNMEDLAKMISYSSCAKLETIINEAAISAAYSRRKSIEMQDLVKTVLKLQYDFSDSDLKASEEELKKRALHEAGHLVVSEVLDEGSVGFASICTSQSNMGGFVHLCKDRPDYNQRILTALAGKAAVELYYADDFASGCGSDLRKAVDLLRDMMAYDSACGFGLLLPADRDDFEETEDFRRRSEIVVYAELERYMLKAKDILLKNRDFLEKTAKALAEKETLLYSDIRAIRESCSKDRAA